MEQKGGEFTYQVFADQISAKRDVQHERRERMTQAASTLREEVPHALSKAMDLASQPGASSWLTSLLIKAHGFCLHKGALLMPWLYATTGHLPRPPHIAPVVPPSLLTTYSPAFAAAFPPYVIRKSEI